MVHHGSESKSVFSVMSHKSQEVRQSPFNSKPVTSILRLTDEDQLHRDRFEVYLDRMIIRGETVDRYEFCAEMPDEGSYGKAFWKIAYSCRLTSFENDWKLVEKYLPKMSTRAKADLKHTTGILMQHYCTPEPNFKRSERYTFHTANGEKKLPGPRPGEFKFVSLRIPRRYTQMVLDLARYWCEHGGKEPVIVTPPNKFCGGEIISLVNHPSFLCSWEDPGSDLGVYFLPNFEHFLVGRETDEGARVISLQFPSMDQVFVLSPDGGSRTFCDDTLINPRKNEEPCKHLTLPKSLVKPVRLEAIIRLFRDFVDGLYNKEENVKEGSK